MDKDPFDKDGRCHYRKAEPQGSEKVPGKKEFDKVSKKHSKAEHQMKEEVTEKRDETTKIGEPKQVSRDVIKKYKNREGKGSKTKPQMRAGMVIW